MAKKYICSSCGSQTKGKSLTKGSIIMELFLWLVFLIPGLIYSIWRLTTKSKVCSECESKEIIPITTPLGKKLLKDFS